MKYIALLLPAILPATFFLCSCAAPVVPRRVPFNEADFTRLPATGSGSVTGQVFVTMTDNTVKIGSNAEVTLLPVNPYTTETIQRKYLRRENLADGDPHYYHYLHSTTSDDQGDFALHQIPPGDYYVGTNVVWSHWIWNTDSEGVMTKSTIAYRTMIYTRISVQNGQTVKVTVWNQCKSRML
jgi:hypothetical protein